MDALICIREFLNRHEAEMAVGILNSGGIEALVQADDCGSMRPNLAFTQGVKLLVKASVLEQEKEILSGRID